ncbi:hypothetical protein [Brevundimonas faecalis]|uniref:ABC-2 type transport system permease protein n=1 Tax=Brevundimonas faecalis TaxID=947378 RepID=A0ABV2R929_9CAUL
MMLVDAIRSETRRLLWNRTALFWSLVFVPAVSLVLTVVGHWFIQAKMADVKGGLPPQLALGGGALDLGRSLVENAGNLANPALLAFLLIGAATVFAGDYRWETWRLITARNTRPNLLMGKAGAVKLMTLTGLILFLVAAMLSEVAKGVIFDRPLAFGLGGEEARQFGLLFLLSYIRVVQFLLVGLLAAVVTRSLLAALFVPLTIGTGQFFLSKAGVLFGWGPADLTPMLLLPGDAYEVLKTAVLGGMPAAVMPDGAVWRALAGLALWAVGPFLLALAWFQRQDLSKE